MTNLRNWRVKKLSAEIASLVVAIMGVVLCFKYWLATSPALAIVGIFFTFAGLASFVDIRKDWTFKKYREKHSKKVRK